MEKGKDFENFNFRKSKWKRVWKLKNLNKNRKGKKERIFFKSNFEKEKRKDFQNLPNYGKN